MNDVDKVNWDNTYSARPFIANASNTTPAHTLPQEVSATQEFRALKHPNTTYAAPAVATTTHKRGFKLVEDEIKAVTSSNDEEVVEDYVGPTVFQNARANPSTIQAGTEETATIDVDMQGATGSPAFTVQPPNLGVSVDSSGELTPGNEAGTVTIRAGDGQNYDETTVTITDPPEPESSEGESE